MTLWQENLTRLIALVEAKLADHRAAVGEFDAADYAGWRQRSNAADKAMIAFFTHEEDARFTERGAHEHTICMAGLRSTSTSGWTGALQNWKRAAEKKTGGAS